VDADEFASRQSEKTGITVVGLVVVVTFGLRVVAVVNFGLDVAGFKVVFRAVDLSVVRFCSRRSNEIAFQSPTNMTVDQVNFKKETTDFQHEILEIINNLTYGGNSQTDGHHRNEDYDHLHFSPVAKETHGFGMQRKMRIVTCSSHQVPKLSKWLKASTRRIESKTRLSNCHEVFIFQQMSWRIQLDDAAGQQIASK
jgi:hypothetical protein